MMQHAKLGVSRVVIKPIGPVLHHQGLLETVPVLQGAAPGALDGYLDRILPVMEADLFGDIADAKEADAFAAKYRCETLAKALYCFWSVSHVLQIAIANCNCKLQWSR